MELSLFDEVADALRGMAPPELGELRVRARTYGIKVWFGPQTPPQEHYEAQVIGPNEVPGAKVLGSRWVSTPNTRRRPTTTQ